MSVLNFDEGNLQEEIKSGITVVDFAAEWCAPCKVLGKVLDGLVNKYEGQIKVGKVDITKELELAIKHRVSNVPCLVIFKDGKEIERMVGFKNAGIVEDLFIKYTE